MAISYTWDVKIVEVYPSHTDNQNPPNTESNVVWNVNWRLKGSDDSNNDGDGNPITGEIFGDINIDVSDLSNFTPFDNLSDSKVQGWVESAMGPEQVQQWKDNVDAQIAEKINPSSVQKIIGG